MNDLQNADEQIEDTICGFCEGEGEHIVHFALDPTENIYETCPICKGKGAKTVNNPQNALEQLRRGISEQRGIAIFPREAQALLDERDALRRALENMLATFQYLYTHDDYLKQRNFKNIPAVKHGRTVIRKIRNTEV